MKRILLGIGTNLGDREANLKTSLKNIEENIGRIIRTSSVYETEPWGFSSENNVLNMVAEAETSLRPSGLLGRILMIEANMGRLRSGKGYDSRIIDIDILFFGERIMRTSSLVIPHPRLHERKFILVPLAEIAPDLLHPVLMKDIKTLLSECSDSCKIRKYEPGNPA